MYRYNILSYKSLNTKMYVKLIFRQIWHVNFAFFENIVIYILYFVMHIL